MLVNQFKFMIMSQIQVCYYLDSIIHYPLLHYKTNKDNVTPVLSSLYHGNFTMVKLCYFGVWDHCNTVLSGSNIVLYYVTYENQYWSQYHYFGNVNVPKGCVRSTLGQNWSVYICYVWHLLQLSMVSLG